MARVRKSITHTRRHARRMVVILSFAWTLVAVAALLIFRHTHPPLPFWYYTIPILLMTAAVELTDFCWLYIAGYLGERAVSHLLSRLPDTYTLLNDVTIQLDDKAAQIDHVLVAPTGIWCVETKNYRGTIHGKEGDKQWTQVKRSRAGRRYKRRFYNPIRQNATHCRRLHQYLQETLGISMPVRSVVVFLDAELRVQTDTPVVGLRRLLPAITDPAAAPCLSPQQYERIVTLLASLEP